jgi:hypothetical protein
VQIALLQTRLKQRKDSEFHTISKFRCHKSITFLDQPKKEDLAESNWLLEFEHRLLLNSSHHHDIQEYRVFLPTSCKERLQEIGFRESLKVVFPCGRTDGRTDGKTDIVSFRNFVDAPKRDSAQIYYSQLLCVSELTLWWEVVHELAPQTNRDLRQMKERYIEKVMGGRAPETRYVILSVG